MLKKTENSVINSYHASPVLFSKILDMGSGIHCGPADTCLKAVGSHGCSSVYLYKVRILVGEFIGVCKDYGRVWDTDRLFSTGVVVYQYKNEYEPSKELLPSYLVKSSDFIEIISVRQVRLGSRDREV